MELILSGNPNLNTIRSVVYLANQHFGYLIDEVRFIDTPETRVFKGRSIESERNESIRRYIPNVSIVSIPITKETLHEQIPRILAAELQTHKPEELVVDLTNGTKSVSNALYAAASLSRIRNLFFLFVGRDKQQISPEELTSEDYIVEIEPGLENLDSIGRNSLFEIVHYRDAAEEITQLFAAIPLKSRFLRESMPDRLNAAIVHHFHANYPASILGIAEIMEAAAQELCTILHNEANKEAQAGNLLGPKKESFDSSVTWLRVNHCESIRSTKEKCLAGYKERFASLANIDLVLDVIRGYRNFAAHPHCLLRGKEESRLVLNNGLYVLRLIQNTLCAK